MGLNQVVQKQVNSWDLQEGAWNHGSPSQDLFYRPFIGQVGQETLMKKSWIIFKLVNGTDLNQ